MIAAAWLVGSLGSAQDWTIQTVAVRDLRVAEHIAEDLVRGGYDAYTEFSMGDDGHQWVRVRVGCYHTRAGAEALAALLRDHASVEAAVVRRSPTAPARGCVRRVVGFRAPDPDAWTQPEPGVPIFVVEVAGVRGVVRYTAEGWRVLQEPATAALAPGSVAEPSFRQAGGVPYAFVEVRHEDGPLHLCPGRLLAQVPEAAVVEHDDVVASCSWRPPATADAAEAP